MHKVHFWLMSVIVNIITVVVIIISLNFIRLLRVVITPSVVVERRKRLEAIG